jgi:hypothetical protein
MATEYLRGEPIDRRFDVFAMGVVLWEMLAGKRCFRGDNEADTLRRLLEEDPAPLTTFDPALAPLDPVIACALAKNRAERFQNAAAMAAALEGAASSAGLLGSHTEVAAALKELVGPALEERRVLVKAKLAHEPSVASLMGVSPLDLPPALGASAPPKPGPAPPLQPTAARPEPIAATTLRDAPPVETPIVRAASTLPTGSPNTKAASTPKMGGGAQPGAGHAEPSAVLAGPPVPTTLPMTPAVLPIPITTMPSATPIDPPPPATPPMIAFVEVPGGRTLRSEDGGDARPALENTGRTGDAAFARSSYPLPAPPRRSLLPVILAAVAVVGFGIAVIALKGRTGTSASSASSALAVPSASAVPSAAASIGSARPEPGAPALVGVGVATVAPSTSTSTTRGKPKVVPTGPAPKPPTPPASVAPPATTRKPPDNPYM